MRTATPLLIRHDWLDVGSGHKLFLAQYGDPKGIPVLYLHGGPGEGCCGEELSLFLDEDFHIYLLDQRGAGRSRADELLANNDLLNLLQDIEKVRNWAEVDRWCLIGGSFGATLGYLYSCIYPSRVISQIYWGMFIPSKQGVTWLYGLDGAAQLFPKKYHQFNPNNVTELALLFEQGFNHGHYNIRDTFITRWLTWELALAIPDVDIDMINLESGRALARIGLHFIKHDYFGAYALLQRVSMEVLAPTVIFQGSQDWVCPASLVDDFFVHYGPPKLRSRVVEHGSHTFRDDRMRTAIMTAVSQMARYARYRTM